jgi:hypothetical protein
LLSIVFKGWMHPTVLGKTRNLDGEIYRRQLANAGSSARPKLAWSWLITVNVDPRTEVRTSGDASDLAEAKAAFRASWLKWP